VSHTRTVPEWSTVRTNWLPGPNETPDTAPPPPERTLINLPLLAFQTRAVPSALAVAR
jgi:hypothetical protein